MEIVVYSTENCGGCDWTKMWLDNHGFDYDEVRVDNNHELMDTLRSKGYLGFPVVSVNNFKKAWAGVDPEALESLKEA